MSRPETHNWGGQGERFTAQGSAEMKNSLDQLSKKALKHKICRKCGVTYSKEEKKCPKCGSEEVF